MTELIDGLIQPEENPPLSGCSEERRRPSRLPSLFKTNSFLKVQKIVVSHISFELRASSEDCILNVCIHKTV